MNLTDFVVGRGPTEVVVRCEVVEHDGTTNIEIRRVVRGPFEKESLPPLNINGLRRLSRHLSALADLLENSRPMKALPPKETVDALVDRVLARRRKEKS